MRQYDAYIVAGGRSPWLLEACGTEFRCLAKINSRPMINYIIDALQQSGCIRRIIIAAQPEILTTLENIVPKNILLCAAAKDMPGSAYAACLALGEDSSQRLLGVCDDIPLLTASGVRDFLRQCENTAYTDVQAFYPIIARSSCQKLFPAAQRTYGKLTDGAFTGGNMMLLDKRVIINGQQLAKEIFALRKSPLRLANWFGWSFIFKAVFRKLSITAAEQRFSEILGAKSKAIITEHAGIGMDVDKPSDLKIIDKYLSQQTLNE